MCGIGGGRALSFHRAEGHLFTLPHGYVANCRYLKFHSAELVSETRAKDFAKPRKAPSGPPTRKVEHQMRQLAQDS